MRSLWVLAWACWMARCGLAGETALAVAKVASGTVVGIEVVSGGSGYVGVPVVTIQGGGGLGATARAVLGGDKVVEVVVLAGGSGYASVPAIVIEPPPRELGVKLRLVPELTVEGPPGSAAKVEWAEALAGPWSTWTHVFVGSGGTVLVDLSPGATQRFYRAVDDPHPPGPAGFAWVPAGTFTMGSPAGELDRSADEAQHVVTLTRGYWVSDHEVTQAEYESLMGVNPSFFGGDATLPVERVSWDDAVLYCQKLTERERVAGRIATTQSYRLPTEAEWEHAARAGTTEARHGALDAIAWWSGNTGGRTHPVGQKSPNAWGLHDMMGNVWEWCADWYGAYPAGPVVDPAGPVAGAGRVYRGGSWLFGPSECRSAVRRFDAASAEYYNVGFRPVLSPVP